MFHVVEFLVNNSIAVVPQIWYKDGCVSWPNYKSDERIDKAARHEEEPQTDWQTYDVRIVKSSDTYLEARQIMKKSLTCDTYDLQTEDEEDVKGKGKKTTRHFFGDTDMDEKEYQLQNRPRKCQPSSTQTQHALSSLTSQGETKANVFEDDGGNNQGTTTPLQPPPPHRPPQYNQQQWGLDDPNQIYKHTWKDGSCGPETIPCSAAEVHILRLLEYIKQQQDQLVAKVDLLSSMIPSTSTPPEAEMPETLQLPLETFEAVEEFEAFMKETANAAARHRMTSSLATIGGQDVKKVTWNILSRMFSNEVAKMICWKGVNGKRPFSQMVSKTVLFENEPFKVPWEWVPPRGQLSVLNLCTGNNCALW